MKLILPIAGCLVASLLSGCAVSTPSMFGNGMAGIGGGGPATNVGMTTTASGSVAGTPVATGSIASSARQEDVGDFPAAGVRAGARSDMEDEEDLSPEELHRRELINRGDLEEGQPLPAQ